MSITKKIHDLKQFDQDFEFYPTTDEILNCIQKHFLSFSEDFNSGHYSSKDYIKKELDDYNKGTYKIHIPSLIDVGTGDGRVLDFFKGNNKNKIFIKKKYGIEISDIHADDLVRKGVSVIGRDFFNTVLIDKRFSIVFSNPPYSKYKMWVNKLLSEVSAFFIYLVIPERWQNDPEFYDFVNSKGEVSIIGNFNFTTGERQARSKVDVICVYNNHNHKLKDPFTEWVENNIGKFEEEIKEDLEIKDTKDVKTFNNDTVQTLIDNYQEEMKELINTYTSLAKIDFNLLREIGISKTGIIDSLKSGIEGLKRKYWHKTFDMLNQITERLTWRTREKILEEIKWFIDLDFTYGNIKTIIVWVIENYNKYMKQQILTCFDDFTGHGNSCIVPYKSNEVWKRGSWRYNGKDIPEKYKLDYRIITRFHGSQYMFTEAEKAKNIVSDLSVIANNLGFLNQKLNDFEVNGTEKMCYSKDGKTIIFTYRLYQNGNVHVKMNKKFIKTFNLEVGKINNWLQEPEDVAREFDMKMKDAVKWFNMNNVPLLGKKGNLMIDFKENNYENRIH